MLCFCSQAPTSVQWVKRAITRTAGASPTAEFAGGGSELLVLSSCSARNDGEVPYYGGRFSRRRPTASPSVPRRAAFADP